MSDLLHNDITRRGFFGAVVTAVISAALIGLLWLVARNAPSAGTDPHFEEPALVATRVPDR
ncbi:MAG: hypothetical protein QM692_02695 [Thermomicrobiales bacterium]